MATRQEVICILPFWDTAFTATNTTTVEYVRRNIGSMYGYMRASHTDVGGEIYALNCHSVFGLELHGSSPKTKLSPPCKPK